METRDPMEEFMKRLMEEKEYVKHKLGFCIKELKQLNECFGDDDDVMQDGDSTEESNVRYWSIRLQDLTEELSRLELERDRERERRLLFENIRSLDLEDVLTRKRVSVRLRLERERRKKLSFRLRAWFSRIFDRF